MASPQTENGYTKIANELLDALARIRIPGEARQILDVIIRKTYGYGKKEDAIALSQFSFATGLKKPEICRSIHKLENMRIIGKKANDVANIYSINKDFTLWKVLAKTPTLAKKPIIVGKKANLPLAKTPPTKESITKEKRKDPSFLERPQTLSKTDEDVERNRERLRKMKEDLVRKEIIS